MPGLFGAVTVAIGAVRAASKAASRAWSLGFVRERRRLGVEVCCR